MTSGTKRAWKLQEFVAHGSNVNCLALGHKSGRVMVTGGEDKKVNMWAVGKPNCIMSLSGHTSPVESVRFMNSEEMVVAGSMSGALKIWDLEAAKIVRTLTGHKSSIRSLDFHPYGDFVGSGSLDTNIKLWDIRRKGCIFTYKGHTNCINCLRFSPDGRWIASAGEDGLVKLWDLTAGKLLADLKQHTGPVNNIEFHPNEFLMASASSDRTVKFWDLETFHMVSTTDGDCGPIRCISFHPEGLCLYAGVQDVLKVYGWEPAQCYDSLMLGWGKPVDIAIAQNQLIGANFSQMNVSTYVADIQRIQPLGGPPVGSQPTSPPPMSASGRRGFNTERPATQSTRQNTAPKSEPTEDKSPSPTEDNEDDGQSSTDIQSPEDYNQIFKPKHRIDRSPTRRVDPFPAPPDDAQGAAPSPPVKTPAAAIGATITKPAPTPQVSAPTVKTQTVKPQAVKTQAVKTPAAPAVATPPTAPTPVAAAPTPKPQTPAIVPGHRNEPAGLDVKEFLPKQASPSISSQQTPPDMSESEVIASVNKGHHPIVTVMSGRHKNLQIIRAMWTGGNIKTAMDSAIGMNDLAVIVDLLNVLNLKVNLWTLDLCTSFLPQMETLLKSKYENYIITGCASLKIILKNFATVIKTNVLSPPSMGVDISREERYRKCKQCYDYLVNVRSSIESKQSHGKLGSTYRELQILMGQLD